MVQGVPLREEEKEYILTHIEREFPSQIARALNRNPATVKEFLKTADD